MKSATDEGSGAMERVVYIYYLPAPTAFDPNLCAFEEYTFVQGQIKMCEKPCMRAIVANTCIHEKSHPHSKETMFNVYIQNMPRKLIRIHFPSLKKDDFLF